jgi:hypothetical protein
MKKFRIISGNSADLVSSNLIEQLRLDGLLFETSENCLRFELHDEKYFVLGDIVGYRNLDGNLNSINDYSEIVEIISKPDRLGELEGRFVVFRIFENNKIDIWSDNFGRIDIYYQLFGNSLFIGSSMDLLPVAHQGSELDNVGIAHSLTVYGSRPAKKHTIYSTVKRLGVYEVLRISQSTPVILKRDFSPKNTESYQEEKLDLYSDIFIESVRARASISGNVVYLSSGWDSTSILAVLVYLFGKEKTRCVIGRMQYSDRSGVINQFEIDRAQAIAKYYGVRLDIVELDYKNDIEKLLDKVVPLFRSHNFANMTGFNHFILAEAVAKTTNGDEVIFAGEMSDGAHNLGFSQYATIFHPSSFDFREYSDKMLSFLHGPTFYKEVQNGSYVDDPIWNIFMERNKNAIFDPINPEKGEINRQFLSSFFLRSGRIPFYSISNSNLLSDYGQKEYLQSSEELYLKQFIENLTTDNIYSTYLHLYNSFHWQGSTVSTLEYTADYFGLKCVTPFHDKFLIDFLSSMPENWGRGLDFNPTKYPLKWMLKNRIDYPLHLQTGPHSYTYDVVQNFSLLGEILNASSFKPILAEALINSSYVDKLDDNFFKLDYIKYLISKYTSGKEILGSERDDIANIAFQSLIGLY